MDTKIYKGDCLELMKEIPNESIDLICCDPPYGTTSIKWDSVLDINKKWEQYDRIIKPKGVMCLFGSQPFSAQLICSKLEWFRYELVWNKNKCGSPGLVKKRPMKTHENILIFYKNAGGTYNPQMTEGKPFKRKSKNKKGYVGKKNDHGYGLKPRKEFENKGTRYPKSILNISQTTLEPVRAKRTSCSIVNPPTSPLVAVIFPLKSTLLAVTLPTWSPLNTLELKNNACVESPRRAPVVDNVFEPILNPPMFPVVAVMSPLITTSPLLDR